MNKGQPRKLDDWGVLSAWGWGMSKVLDYFETDKTVDARKVAVQGHSRTGKAALVAMAYDERFLTGFISSSGQAGAKLHRRKYGELVENIAALNEYHWMAGNYLKYAGRWDQLPVDSHELVAMCAPRPVFLSAGKGPDTNPDGTIKMLSPGDPNVILSRGPVEQQAANINDAWVDAKGTFLAGVGASPVYRLLGKKDLGTTEFPAIETASCRETSASVSTRLATHPDRTGRCSWTLPRSTSARRQPGRRLRRTRARRGSAFGARRSALGRSRKLEVAAEGGSWRSRKQPRAGSGSGEAGSGEREARSGSGKREAGSEKQIQPGTPEGMPGCADLELDPRADLHLSRRVARVVGRQQQELRRRLVAGRVREVRAVRQVEDVDERLQPAAVRQREAIAESRVELEEPGP